MGPKPSALGRTLSAGEALNQGRRPTLGRQSQFMGHCGLPTSYTRLRPHDCLTCNCFSCALAPTVCFSGANLINRIFTREIWVFQHEESTDDKDFKALDIHKYRPTLKSWTIELCTKPCENGLTFHVPLSGG